MHLRKTRKAKAAASEFVKRVISGKDISPDRKDATSSKGSKPATSKQAAKGNTSSRPKSPSRGRPSSPRTAPRTATNAAKRATSRSPSRASDTKAKAPAQNAKSESPVPAKVPARRGRPPKYPRPESPSDAGSKAKGQSTKSSAAKKAEDQKPKERASEKAVDKKKQPKSTAPTPPPKVVASPKGKSTQGQSPKSSAVPAAAVVKPETSVQLAKESSPTKHAEIKVLKPPEESPIKLLPPAASTSTEDGSKSQNVITPRIVFVDQKAENKSVARTTSPQVSVVPQPPLARIRAQPQAFKPGNPIKISPTAKLIPVSSLSNINTAGKSLFTISIPGSSLAKTVAQGQSTQFIVSAQPMGSTTASPIKLTATASGSSPGQVTLDLVELAKSVTALTPQKTQPPDPAPVARQEPSTPSPPIINKSPKFLLSSSKHSKDEPVSEGKIKKRKRSKVAAWDVPSAVYMSQFDAPQARFSRVDGEILYPEDAKMEQSDYFRIMGIINKADIKKTDGTEHRNHRLAGGKLRRVCKPKISPEMVYRRFSLARGCIMHDVFVDSDEDNADGAHSPRVADKNAIIKTEQTKKRSLSPKMHDSYRQHCNKIPLITIEKVSKDGSGSEGEATPSKSGSGNSLKENEPPHGARKCDWECGEGSSTGTPKAKKKDNPVKKSVPSPKNKSKSGARKQLDLKPSGSKMLHKSKSFEGPSKKSGKQSLEKSKSFERCSGSQAKHVSKQLLVPKAEPEEDDGNTRRSARNRGSKRKQWWHLLRANPDEFEEDKEWDKEIAIQEQKRKARLERAREKAEEEAEESDEEEEDEQETQEKEATKKSKKKAKVKKEPDSEGDGVDTKTYIDLYESKLKNKKKRSKDWALAKKVLEEAQAQAKLKEESEDGTAGKSKKSKKEGAKRKACDGLSSDSLVKRIKTEPLSPHNSDDETAPDRSAAEKKSKLKKKKSIGSTEPDEPVDEKPEIITNLVILGEDGEPLQAKENANLYDQLQTLLEGKESEKLARTGVLELSATRESPQSFIEILAREQQKLTQRPHSPFGMLPIVRSDVLYKTKEGECIAPHMCSVCWINDHMYCRNMKRIARDLPLCGGCIHYVPCQHYLQKESPSAIDRKHMQRRVRQSLYTTINTTNSNRKTVMPLAGSPFQSAAARKINFSEEEGQTGSLQSDQLLCDESLTESDSEPTSPEAPPPPGTELLKAELRARARQIKRALGFKSLPQTISPLKRRLQWAMPGKVADLPVETLVIDDEDEDSDDTEVTVMEYALVETVGKLPEEDYGVPLCEEYVLKETDVRKESWSTGGNSVFMPNTESDASNDSYDITMEPVPSTATEHAYEESVFGENSQDSTETSLSQISTHVESDDSEVERLIGSEPSLPSKEERRRKKKRKSVSDVIHVKSVGGEPMTDISFEGLKNKWQPGEDGTQVLTFTTKEIRERKPELLSYIKRAGLLDVITDKLCQEKNSIKKLVKDNDSTLRQSQDKLEQQRCLMAAVLTEILSVKDQLRDLQTALVDEESICSKLRKEKKDVTKQCSVAETKVNILKKIMHQARERGLVTQPGAAQTDPESDVRMDATDVTMESDLHMDRSDITLGSSMRPESNTMQVVEEPSELPDVHSITAESVSAQPAVMPGKASEGLHRTDGTVVLEMDEVSETRSDLPEVACLVGAEAAVSVTSSVTVDTENGAASPLVFAGQQFEGQADASEAVVIAQDVDSQYNIGVTGEPAAQPATSVSIRDDVPLTGPASKEASPELTTPGEPGQVVSVSIEGGHSHPHSVMLELPKELLQCQPVTGELNSLNEASALSAQVMTEHAEASLHPDTEMQQVHIAGDLQDVIVESDSLDIASADVSAPGTLIIESESNTGNQMHNNLMDQPPSAATQVVHDISQQQTLQITGQEVRSVSQTDLMQDLGELPSSCEIQPAHPVTSSSLVIRESPELASRVIQQQTLEASLKPETADFDNIIMRPGDLGDVILQANDMGTLSLQQGDLGNLVVQQGDLPLTVDSVGLNTFLTSQSQLDDGMLVQQEDNYIIQQQPQPGLASDKPVYLQTANNGTLFVQASDTAPLQHQPTTNANVLVQPSHPQNIILQQQVQQPQPSLQNIILQADSSQNVLLQDASMSTMDSDVHSNLVVQQGQDLVLQNLDFVQGLGQVQTVMIEGQPYQVILQTAEST